MSYVFDTADKKYSTIKNGKLIINPTKDKSKLSIDPYRCLLSQSSTSLSMKRPNTQLNQRTNNNKSHSVLKSN